MPRKPKSNSSPPQIHLLLLPKNRNKKRKTIKTIKLEILLLIVRKEHLQIQAHPRVELTFHLILLTFPILLKTQRQKRLLRDIDSHQKDHLTDKITPSGGQKLEPTFVDKDKDTKNDNHTPTEVANNELPNRQLDEDNNACMPSNEGKDCRHKEVPTACCSNEECVKTALEHTICKEDTSEEVISDDPCDADDVSESYDINVITFTVLFCQNIKHKLKIY